MRRVQNQEELAQLVGRVTPAQTAPPPTAPPAVDPNILSMQVQVAQVADSVARLADSIAAQEAARSLGLEATIERDGKGIAQRIIVKRIQK
jgi:hypothetical protein